MPTDFEEWTKKVPIIYQNEITRNSGEIHSVVSSIDKKQSFGYRDLGTSISSNSYNTDSSPHFITCAVLHKDFLKFTFGGLEDDKTTLEFQIDPNSDMLTVVFLFIKTIEEKLQS